SRYRPAAAGAVGSHPPTTASDPPVRTPASTATARAADNGKRGMNIPTTPPPETGDRNCDDTTRLPEDPPLVNSTAPNEPGDENKLTPTSSKPFASLTPN